MPTETIDAAVPTRRGILLPVSLIVIGAIAFVACFAASLTIFAGLSPDTGGAVPLFLGIPWPTAGLAFATVPIGIGITMLASRDSTAAPAPHRVALGVTVIVFGITGLVAAWALTADKIITLTEPSTELGCNFSLIVQCGANLSSPQGAVFGFPNPLIGLACWVAVLIFGAAVLLGRPMARWYRILFAAGVSAALLLVCWLIVQSIYVLGTLCPWCMTTWLVTIPLFWLAWAAALHDAPRSALRQTSRVLFSWVPLITIVCLVVIAVMAQTRLDVLDLL